MNAARGRNHGWTAYAPVYTIEIAAEASTRESAVASAITPCAPLPDGWQAPGEARPER